MVDPLSYFSFQPVPHDWCNKGHGMCYPVCGMVHILIYPEHTLCVCTCGWGGGLGGGLGGGGGNPLQSKHLASCKILSGKTIK